MTAANSSEGSEQKPTTTSLTAAEIALSDPLKSETRKARLYLLGVSMVGITIVWTGLVPQEITTLGIQFGKADRQSLLVILALAVLYFFAAFAMYGAADFIAWRYAHTQASWPEIAEEFEAHWREEQRQHEERLENLLARDDDTAQWFQGERRAQEMQALRETERRRMLKEYADQKLRAPMYTKYASSLSIFRAFFEFVLPLMVGAVSVYVLLAA